MKRIFIIDDQPQFLRIATKLLQDEGYIVEASAEPTSGLQKILSNPPDLLLLDIRLPEKDGFQICKEIRADVRVASMPIIMISVKTEVSNLVLGLELGANDYISKPFREEELLARVKKALSLNKKNPEQELITVGPFSVDFRSYNATLGKKLLNLTPKEFQLLGFFLRNEGRVLTRGTICEKVWGVDFHGSSRTVDVHVDRLRGKLGTYGDWIKGLKGVGYRFQCEA